MKSTYPNEFSFRPDSLADKLIFKNTANKEFFKRIYTTYFGFKNIFEIMAEK